MSWNNITPAWTLDEKGKKMNANDKPVAEKPVVPTDDMDIPEFLNRDAEAKAKAEATKEAAGTDTQPA